MMLKQPHGSSSISVNQPKTSCSSSEGFVTMRSQSIPISSIHFHRTASEIQLCLDEQIAEHRDNIFFTRVVKGIQQSQLAGKNRYLQMQNQVCLAHILQTRKESNHQQSQQRPTTMPGFIPMPEQQQQQQQDEWSSGVGLSIDAPSSSSLPPPPYFNRRDLNSITADAIAIADNVDDMIFDLEL